MIRKILAPLDPSRYSEKAVDYAIELAKIYDAEIAGLVILDLPGIKSHIGPLPPGVSFYAKELEKSLVDTAKVHLENILSKFRNKCDAAGVKRSEIIDQGDPKEKIAEHSAFYDLLVMGLRLHFDFETDDEPDNSLLDFTLACSAPVLAVPDDEEKINLSKSPFNATIAFNGSPQSIKATRYFAQMEFPKEKIKATVVMANVNDEEKEKARLRFDYLKNYLSAHKIKNVESYITSKDKIETFQAFLIENSDLIVLGAHSKRGAVDFLFGSLAKYLINEAKTPLLICQ